MNKSLDSDPEIKEISIEEEKVDFLNRKSEDFLISHSEITEDQAISGWEMSGLIPL